MNAPKRWTEDGAPEAVRSLLASARQPRAMTEPETARSLERVQRMAAAPVAVGSTRWTKLSAGVATVGVAAMLLTIRPGSRHTETLAADDGPLAVTSSAGAVVPATTPATPVTSEPELPPTPAVVPAAKVSDRPVRPPPPLKARAPTEVVTERTPSPEDSILREAAILEQARSSLASNPARALDLCNQHQREFPEGQLRAEEELLALESLSKLGRREAARAKAKSPLLLGSAFYAERARRIVESLPRDDVSAQ
jgi:hypothetical protein